MEPAAAQHWADVAAVMLSSGTVPVIDKRNGDTYGSSDYGSLFRVNAKGEVDNANGQVQVVRMSDPIAKYDYCGSLGSQTYAQHILAADADPTVKSILLWIDSPGGQVDGTEQLAKAVKFAKKPVVAYTDGMMASAAYWIGSSAREIIASGDNGGWNNVIGSIGTMAMFRDDSAKLEKEGVRIHAVFATQSKDKWGDFREMQSGNFTKLIESLDGINASFLSAVQSNRTGKLDLDNENVLTGKTYNAKKAIKYGLIDKIGDFKLAVKRSLQLSQQLLNTNTMAFERTRAASGTDGFQVIDDGFLATEEQLNNIEATIEQRDTRITELEQQAQQFQEQVQASTQAMTDATEQLAAANQQVADLQARITELERLPGAGVPGTVTSADDTVPGATEPYVSEVTKQANKLRVASGLPPIV